MRDRVLARRSSPARAAVSATTSPVVNTVAAATLVASTPIIFSVGQSGGRARARRAVRAGGRLAGREARRAPPARRAGLPAASSSERMTTNAYLRPGCRTKPGRGATASRFAGDPAVRGRRRRRPWGRACRARATRVDVDEEDGRRLVRGDDRRRVDRPGARRRSGSKRRAPWGTRGAPSRPCSSGPMVSRNEGNGSPVRSGVPFAVSRRSDG